MTDNNAPEQLFCWNFQTDPEAWEKGWGGYCRTQNLAPLEEKERKTGAVYVPKTLLTAAQARIKALERLLGTGQADCDYVRCKGG